LSVLPTGVGPDTKSIVSSENLSAGDFVNIWDNAGVPNVRKTDAAAAAAGKSCDGFVKAAVTSPAAASVYFEGKNDQLSGLTIGAIYYVSATAGAATTTAPSTPGYMSQRVGKAISATEISFEPDDPIILA